jgi:hypothetical protein
MNDLEVLEEFLMVDHVAERMGWTVVPTLCGKAVRLLQSLAGNADSHPNDVMRAIDALKIAIGPTNLAAVLSHDIWDDWCPSPADPELFDNGSGVVMWAGNRGYVKGVESAADGQLTMNLHSVQRH